MKRNLELTRGLVFSQAVLLKLIDKGITREDSYKIVQTSAMDVWADKDKNLKDELMKSEIVMNHLSKEEVEQIFSSGRMIKNVEYIFNRSINAS